MRVLFITSIPSPYRVSFFNELGKYVDLTVLFEKKKSDERDDSWNDYRFDTFKGIIMKGVKTSVSTAFCPEVVRFLSQNWDRIVCCDIYTLTGIYAINYMRRKGIPYWIEGDGAFAKNGKGIKEKIKKYVISGAEGYFSTSEEHDKYYLMYGAEERKIYRYPFSSVMMHELLCLNGTNEDERIAEREKIRINARKKLHISDGIMFLMIGQFIHRKGFDVLLKSIKSINKNYQFYFIGGVPTEDYLQIQKDNHLENVKFIGFIKPDELAVYYDAADVFILPTREDIWGLVVNEAMAHALPVITTDRCVAGLEMVNEENGRLIPIEDEGALRSAIENIAQDEQRGLKGIKALEKASHYTIDEMAKCHYEVFIKSSYPF